MNHFIRGDGAAWVLAACTAWLAGCGGGDSTELSNTTTSTKVTTSTTGTSTSTTGGGGGQGGAGGSTGTGGTGGHTGKGGGGGAGGNTGTGGAGGAGGAPAVDQGHTGADFVNAGVVAKSKNYRLVLTVGQSSPHQGAAKSSKYQMQGGVIGATGSKK
jgi:hypothetical protein